MPIDPVTGVQALSAVAALAKGLAALHNAPDRVQDCLELVQLLYRDRELLVALMNEHVDLKNGQPGEWRRLEEKLADSGRVLEETGRVLRRYRPETRGAVVWRAAWVIADADTLAAKVPKLQMQQATVLAEVNGLQARQRLRPVVAMAEAVVEEARRLENLDLLNSLMGKRAVSAEPAAGRDAGATGRAPGQNTVPVSTFSPPASPVRHRRSFYDGLGLPLEPPPPQHLHRRMSFGSLAPPDDPPPPYHFSGAGEPAQFNLNPVVGFVSTGPARLPVDSWNRTSLPFAVPAPQPPLHHRSFSDSSYVAPDTDTAKGASISALFGGTSRKPSSRLGSSALDPSPHFTPLSPRFSPPMLSPSMSSEAATLSPGLSPPTPFDWAQPRLTTPLSSPHAPPIEVRDSKSAGLSSLFGHKAVMAETVQPLVHEIDDSSRGFSDVYELDAGSLRPGPATTYLPFAPPAVPPKLR